MGAERAIVGAERAVLGAGRLRGGRGGGGFAAVEEHECLSAPRDDLGRVVAQWDHRRERHIERLALGEQLLEPAWVGVGLAAHALRGLLLPGFGLEQPLVRVRQLGEYGRPLGLEPAHL